MVVVVCTSYEVGPLVHDESAYEKKRSQPERGTVDECGDSEHAVKNERTHFFLDFFLILDAG